MHHNSDEMLSLEYLGSLDYIHLRLLDELLKPEMKELYDQKDVSVNTIVHMAEGVRKLLNPIKYIDERPDESFFAIRRMAQVYVEEGIDLARINIEDNPLGLDKFEGQINVVIAYNQSAPAYVFLEELGLNNLAPLTNYEPNYLQALVNQRSEIALSVQVEIIVNDVNGGLAHPDLYDIMSGDSTGGS